MLSLFQKIAIKYNRVVDSNSLLYNTFKDIPRVLRLLIYLLMSSLTFITLKFMASFITWDMSILIYTITIGVSLILFYESIYHINLKARLALLKEQESYIKKNKLQKWRLRNMNVFLRILIYIIGYIVILNIYNFISLLSFYQVAFSTSTLTDTDVQEFIYAHKELLRYITIFYILVLGIIEYFIPKRGSHV